MNCKTIWGCLLFLCSWPGIASSQENVGLSVTAGLTINEVTAGSSGAEAREITSPAMEAPAAASLQTVTQSTSLRRGPGASFLVIKRLHPGYELIPIGDFGEKYWVNVHYADTTGWVKKALLKDLGEMPVAPAGAQETDPATPISAAEPAPAPAVLSETAVRTIGPDYSGLPPFVVYRETSLRDNPEKGARSLKRLPKGVRVKVIDPRSERYWTKVQYQDQIGWAPKDLLDPTE